MRGGAVSYTHLRAHETRHDLVCRLLLEKKKGKFVSNSITNCAVIEIYDGDPKSTVFKHHIWSYLLMVVCVCHGKRAAWLCLVLCLVEVGAHRLHFVLRGSCLT